MSDSTGEPENNSGRNATSEEQPSVQRYLIDNKYDTCLWLIRIYIVFSAMCYLVPVFGVESSQNCYKRVLIGSAAISALRLHQRMPRIQFSMDFARQLVIEDSFHYFIYSVLFLLSSGATMVLVPIVIFAVLHIATYTRKVIRISQSNNFLVQRISALISKVENGEIQQQMFLFIACSEILVFVVSILLLFSGQGSLFVPFFYYRFLQLRYSSRRNPYSRIAFQQFRMGIEQLAYHPRCPTICNKLLLGIISVAIRLAPAT